MKYRKIETADDEAIAGIIRTNLEKLHLNIPGTAYFDPQLDHMSAYYNIGTEKRAYFVARDEADAVVGGVGIAEFKGIPDCAEIQKLYLNDAAKGKGYGRELMRIAESRAREAGCKRLYLETHASLKAAMHLYEKLGFHQIEKPQTVLHGTMDRFYLKELSSSAFNSDRCGSIKEAECGHRQPTDEHKMDTESIRYE